LIIAAGLAGYIYWAAIPSLWPKDSMTVPGTGLIAVDLPQETGSAWIWANTDEPIAPFAPDRISIRFWLSSSAPVGATFILGGPLTSGLSCYGDSIKADLEPKGFDELTADQQDLVTDYFEFMPTHGLVSSSWDGSLDEADALSAATSDRYVTVEIKSFVPETRIFTADGEADRSVPSNLGNFVCSLPADALFSRRSGVDIYTVPGVMARAKLIASPNSLTLHRSFEFKPTDKTFLNFSSTNVDYSATPLITIANDWQAWDMDEAAVIALQPETASFEKDDAQDARQSAFFWLGLAAATIVTLVLSLLKLGSDAVMDVVVASSAPDAREAGDEG